MVEHAPLMREDAGSIPAQASRLLSRVRVGPYKRVPGSQTLEHTLQKLLLRGEPSGEVASHCNPRHKGACNPNSSKDPVSGAHIQATVCVGAAINPWTCQDVGIEMSRINYPSGRLSGHNGR